MKTKLVIFDLDGTLVNSLYDLADAVNYALAKNGLPTHEREKYRFMVGNGRSVLADRAMMIPEGSDSELKRAVLADYDHYYGGHYKDNTRPYEGTAELLKALDEKGVGYCVLSNKPDFFTKAIISELFPGSDFAYVMGKRDEFPTKPDPASVNAVMRELSVTAEECLYIGDSNVDMKTAANAGIESVGVSWGFRSVEELEAAGASHIADVPGDILKYLKEQ